ncbi:TPA: hypothetical protein ACGO4O_001883, partial [Streptococcus suis]
YLECKKQTNLSINHCAEMLTRTLRRGAGLSAQPQPTTWQCESSRVLSALGETKTFALFPTFKGSPNL